MVKRHRSENYLKCQYVQLNSTSAVATQTDKCDNEGVETKGATVVQSSSGNSEMIQMCFPGAHKLNTACTLADRALVSEKKKRKAADVIDLRI